MLNFDYAKLKFFSGIYLDFEFHFKKCNCILKELAVMNDFLKEEW